MIALYQAPNYLYIFSNILCLEKHNFSKLAILIIVCILPSQFLLVFVMAVKN